ncbi:hypothetical protein JHK82_042923 [Glycine max]|nr:hypothetical protein JHK82_042923 [Glycine max]
MKKLGHLKDEVRNATKFDLPNKDRKDSQGICFLGKRKYMLRKVTIQLKLVEGDSAGTRPFLSQCIELFSSADNPICINELNITSLGIMEIPICLGGSISSIGSTLYVLIFLLTSLSSVEVPVLCSPVPFQNYALSSLDLDQVYIELKLDGLFCSHVCFVVWHGTARVEPKKLYYINIKQNRDKLERGFVSLQIWLIRVPLARAKNEGSQSSKTQSKTLTLSPLFTGIGVYFIATGWNMIGGLSKGPVEVF